MTEDEFMLDTFYRFKKFAIVGISRTWQRPSNFVGKYLLYHGYSVYPVNPKYTSVLGQRCFPRLSDVVDSIEVVICFRRADSLLQLLPEFNKKKVKVLWLQLGIICEKVKAEAEALGIQVVMDRCIKIEHARLFGGLNFMGVNTKVISSKRSRIVFN
ncbi:MAG: CoA-binding protein [Pseudomonadota bacterium]|nr:CoA-binding protein [Pseudomonadota bacterium]